MKTQFIFPTIMITLDLLAGVIYMMHGDYKKLIYWVAAAVLNAAVTFQKGCDLMKVKELHAYLEQFSDETEIFTCHEDNNIITAHDTVKAICAISDTSGNDNKIILIHD